MTARTQETIVQLQWLNIGLLTFRATSVVANDSSAISRRGVTSADDCRFGASATEGKKMRTVRVHHRLLCHNGLFWWSEETQMNPVHSESSLNHNDAYAVMLCEQSFARCRPRHVCRTPKLYASCRDGSSSHLPKVRQEDWALCTKTEHCARTSSQARLKMQLG